MTIFKNWYCNRKLENNKIKKVLFPVTEYKEVTLSVTSSICSADGTVSATQFHPPRRRSVIINFNTGLVRKNNIVRPLE